MSSVSRYEVIMPALGMTQDTGDIVAWHKAVGDAVKADDILFEVETDKTTMEVEAGFVGFVAEINSAAGATVPVGSVIAVLSSEAVEGMDDGGVVAPRSVADAAAAPSTKTSAPVTELEASAELANQPSPKPYRAPQKAPVLLDLSRTLASPKARFIANQQGLELSQLLQSGVVQPIQSADVLSFQATPARFATPQCQLQARIPRGELDRFASWAREHTDGLVTHGKIWCVFCSAALRKAREMRAGERVVVLIEQWSDRLQDIVSVNADSVGLLEVDTTRAEAAADLVVRNMSGTAFVNYQPANSPGVPTVTITDERDDSLLLTLRFDENVLSLEQSLVLLQAIKNRAEQPLRHLL